MVWPPYPLSAMLSMFLSPWRGSPEEGRRSGFDSHEFKGRRSLHRVRLPDGISKLALSKVATATEVATGSMSRKTQTQLLFDTTSSRCNRLSYEPVGRVAEWFKAHAWKVCVR